MKYLVPLIFLAFFLLSCGGNNSQDGNSAQSNAETQQVSNKRSAASNLKDEPLRAGQKLHLYGGNATAAPGSNFCIDVTVRGFKALMSMQYTMKWNPDIIQLTELKDFGLPFMDKRNFGMHSVNKGILTFVWIDNDLKGLTLEDNSPIFHLCFDAIGEHGQGTTFHFIEKPTPFESVNSEEKVIGIIGHEGIIKLKN